MFKGKIVNVQYLIVVFVWVLIFASPILFGENGYTIVWPHILKIWREYCLILFIFLLNHFILVPYLFFRGRRLLYFVSLISIVTLFIGGLYFVYLYTQPTGINSALASIPPPHGHGQIVPPPTRGEAQFIPPYANLLVMVILILGFDTGLILSNKWIQSEQNKLLLEKESIANKMSFLQNQISPHFFMNTLNNIHALVDISVDEAKASIIKLSHLMDYMLYESQTERIFLHREIEFIESYVELMRLRFTDEVTINMHVPENMPKVSIPPLLTISFIENAFKFGISYEEPSYINMSFSFKDNQMCFEIENTIHIRKEIKSGSGIGLKNARNRLELIYPENHSLIVEQLPGNLFAVKLNIPI